jgi:transcriptional regulator with XRE-family HTH domain
MEGNDYARSAQRRTKMAFYPNNIGYCIKKYGYTRTEVANEVGIDRKTLYLYCSGQLAPPKYTLEKIARTLGCSAKELMDAPAEGNEKQAQHFTDSTEPISSGEVGLETLASFADLTENCRHLSEGNELKAAERILWAYLPRIEAIAKLSFEHQQRAANIVSQSYLLAASLAGQRNELQTRHHFSQQALLYGNLAQDRNLQITALRQLSITYDYMARPDKVLQVFQQAFPYMNEVSSLLQACVYAGVSGAYSQLKQEQESLRFMGLAYEHFPPNLEQESGYLHTLCRYSSLVFFDGLNHLELGRPHEAEEVLARIDGLQPKIQIPERVRIELLNYQVEVFMTLRDMERTCIYLEAAVQAAMAIGSERRFQESLVLFQQMQQIWPHESRIRQLRDFFVR